MTENNFTKILTHKIKILISVLILLTLVSCDASPIDAPYYVYKAQITAVIDGDTIQVQFNEDLPQGCSRSERVRLIGVNTPELTTDPPEYFADEARSYTNRFYRQTVFIEFDSVSAMRDKYGRLLAYVYNDLSNMTINKQLIIGGYGYFYGVFSFDPYRMQEFKQAEEYARFNKKGIWE